MKASAVSMNILEKIRGELDYDFKDVINYEHGKAWMEYGIGNVSNLLWFVEM